MRDAILAEAEIESIVYDGPADDGNGSSWIWPRDLGKACGSPRKEPEPYGLGQCSAAANGPKPA